MTSREALETIKNKKALIDDEWVINFGNAYPKLFSVIEKDLEILEILKPGIHLKDNKTKNEPQIVEVAFIEAKGFVLKNSRAYELLKEWLENEK